MKVGGCDAAEDKNAKIPVVPAETTPISKSSIKAGLLVVTRLKLAII